MMWDVIIYHFPIFDGSLGKQPLKLGLEGVITSLVHVPVCTYPHPKNNFMPYIRLNPFSGTANQET